MAYKLLFHRMPVIIIKILAIFFLNTATMAQEDANIAIFDDEQLEREFQKHKQAAVKGDVRAQYALGFMYLQGEGVGQDTEMAFKWVHLAARSGLPEAQDTLAYMYKKGLGIKSDRVRSYVWYTVAATNGIFLANRILNSMAKELSPAEHVQARVMLKEYLQNYVSKN